MEQYVFRKLPWVQLVLRKQFAVAAVRFSQLYMFVVAVVVNYGVHRNQQQYSRKTQNRKISYNQNQQLMVAGPIPTERLFEFVIVYLFGIVVLEHVFRLLVPERILFHRVNVCLYNLNNCFTMRTVEHKLFDVVLTLL